MNLSLEMVLRCLDLLPILRENQGITLDRLAEVTGFTRKYIADELIPALMLCGSPPYMPHDYVSVDLDGDKVFLQFADHFQRPVTLLPVEIMALHLALTTVRFRNDHLPQIRSRLKELIEKIENALPEDLRVLLRESHRISFGDRKDEESPWFLSLREAAEQRRQVRIDYLSWGDSEIKRRVIHPYGLVTLDGVTYVVAHDSLRGYEVSFRLDRIHGLEVLDDGFEIDAGFSLEDRVRQGLFQRPGVDEKEVQIRFRGPASTLISEMFDPSRWNREKDRSVVLRLNTSRPNSVVRWALRFGTDAEVVGPKDVRRLAVEELGKLRAAYAE